LPIFTSQIPESEEVQKNTAVVLPVAAIPDCSVVYIYSNPLWTKLDRTPGYQTTFPGLANQGKH
jgi:hypothetical protein